MENTTEIQLPDFKKEKLEKTPKPKKVVEKEILPRSNREVKCAYCGAVKTLNPDQYQKRFDYFGSEEAVERHFQCQECETAENTNPIRFAFDHSTLVNTLAIRLKPVFETFTFSPKTNNDVLRLQNETTQLLTEYAVTAKNFEFIIENKLPEALKINFPFVGDVVIRPKEYLVAKKISVL
jgi:hypothetical protein